MKPQYVGMQVGDPKRSMDYLEPRSDQFQVTAELQWTAAMQRQKISYLSAEMQLSVTDARGKCSNVNEP